MHLMIFMGNGTHYTAVVVSEKTRRQLQDEEQAAFQRMRDLGKQSQLDPTKRVAALEAMKEWMNAHKAVIARTEKG